MKLSTMLIAVLVFVLTSTGHAQKIKVVSGNLDFLKGQTILNIQHSYDSMSVGAYEREEDYVNDRVREYNEKEPGKGDKWKKYWFDQRESRYEPMFEAMINVALKKANVVVADNSEAPYTLRLRTTATEPGFDLWASKRASVDYEVVFFRTGSDEVLAVVEMLDAYGRGDMGFDFDTGNRIMQAYKKAGTGLGEFLMKRVYN